ncbi:MAG TPA: DUF4388 domain-containing protein, partial [Mycobacteriales bacterium]|nr:DUF4388 domain-containing protein [Mycobacteriales bacterium]
MQRGDLGEAPLSVLLTRLAADKPSGCLHVTRAAEGGLPAGPEALVHLRGGRVYAASAGAERFLVGTRLVTSFGVDPTSVNEALAAQETDLTGWRVGEILVHLGYVDATAVETISREQVLEALTEIEGWRAGSWRFRPGVRTRAMLAEPIDAGDAVAAIAARQQEWADLQAVVPGPRAIARLSAEPAASEALEVDADAWALLSGIDGVRTVADLGRLRGFSLLETARGLSVLVGAGLVEVEGDPTETTENASVASMLTALEHDAPATDAEAAGAPGDSLLRVSAALSALMGSETQGGEQRDAAAADDGVADVVDLAAAREAKAREEHRAAQLDAERHERERMAAAETARREAERRAREERAAAE